jgi:hypothetical protein
MIMQVGIAKVKGRSKIVRQGTISAMDTKAKGILNLKI